MEPGRCVRVVRAAMFAAVCVLLAATGHVLMSQAAVSWWATAAGLLVTAGAAWVLAGRERGLLAVTSAAVVVQTALHTGFTLAQTFAQPPPPAGGTFARQWAERLLCGDGALSLSEREATKVVVDAGLGSLISRPPPGLGTGPGGTGDPGHHTTHGMATDATATIGSAAHGAHDLVSMASTGMLAAHLLAAVLSGLWLAYGERALFRVLRVLVRWLWTPLQLLLRVAVPPRRPRPRVRRRRTRVRAQLLLSHSITSRGPPAGTAVL